MSVTSVLRSALRRRLPPTHTRIPTSSFVQRRYASTSLYNTELAGLTEEQAEVRLSCGILMLDFSWFVVPGRRD